MPRLRSASILPDFAVTKSEALGDHGRGPSERPLSQERNARGMVPRLR